jgi:hypothetical protein
VYNKDQAHRFSLGFGLAVPFCRNSFACEQFGALFQIEGAALLFAGPQSPGGLVLLLRSGSTVRSVRQPEIALGKILFTNALDVEYPC